MELWHRLIKLCYEEMTESYQNLRERIGSCLSTILWFDLDGVFVDKSVPPKFRPPRVSDMMACINTMVIFYEAIFYQFFC